MPIEQRYAQRGDTAANWSATNPILAAHEIGIDSTSRRFKIGDGVTAWNALPFATPEPGLGATRGVAGDRFMGNQAPSGTLAVTLNREYAAPFILPASTSVGSVSVHVATAGAGSALRVGWRSDSQGWPGSLVAEIGTVSTATTGYATLAAPFAPPSDGTLWWLTLAVQGGTAPTLAQNSTPPTALVTLPRTTDWGTAARLVPVQDSVSGALPTSFSARAGVSTMVGSHPAVALTLA